MNNFPIGFSLSLSEATFMDLITLPDRYSPTVLPKIAKSLSIIFARYLRDIMSVQNAIEYLELHKIDASKHKKLGAISGIDLLRKYHPEVHDFVNTLTYYQWENSQDHYDQELARFIEAHYPKLENMIMDIIKKSEEKKLEEDLLELESMLTG
jgi:hypothetical protein